MIQTLTSLYCCGSLALLFGQLYSVLQNPQRHPGPGRQGAMGGTQTAHGSLGLPAKRDEVAGSRRFPGMLAKQAKPLF